jgi:hypothetical protein
MLTVATQVATQRGNSNMSSLKNETLSNSTTAIA